METQRGVFLGLKASAGRAGVTGVLLSIQGQAGRRPRQPGGWPSQAAVCNARGFRSGQEAVRFGSRVQGTGRGGHSNNNS